MPRKYSRKTSRATSYTQEALEIAIQKIRNKELSYSAASRIFGIPTSTLSDRVLQKTALVSKTLGRSTAIPMELEKQLADGLRAMEKWGWGLSREEVLDVTEKFVKRNNLETPFNNGRPGPDWFISFRKRHNLSIKKPQPVEYLRKRMTDPFVIHEYFTLLETTLRELNINDPKRIWNLDETSVCFDPTKTKVVGGKGAPCTRTTYGNAKENVTVLTTVNAAGDKLDPLIVFKGKYMYKQWMLENPDEYDFQLTYAASKRGWMESEIFYNYMLNVVIPNLGEERPVLLLYDGHVSHVDDRVVALAVENNITIIKLPAHTSHLLQPLDLAVFKSFKAIWDKNLVKWQRQNVGVKLQKQGFSRMFPEAWKETKPKVIQNGFAKGGIYPFNPSCIPKEKFDPKAYARWQKQMSQMIFKEPKALKQLCLDKINTNMTYNSHAAAQNCTVIHSEIANSTQKRTLQPVNITFEEILLDKVTQHPQNKTPVKLKRFAKGSEVITKTYIEKKKDIEFNKARETQVQKTKKPIQNLASQSQKHAADLIKPGPSGLQKTKLQKKKAKDVAPISDFVQPGPSGIQKTKLKAKDVAPILTDMTNNVKKDNVLENKSTKKGKGIGKKTRTDIENQTPKNYEICVNTNISHNTTDLIVPNELKITKKLTDTKKYVSKKKRTFSTDMAAKKRKRSSSASTTTIESVQMSVHSDSDLFDSFSDILSDCSEWNKTDSINHEKNKTPSELAKEQKIQKIVKDIHDIEKNIGNPREQSTSTESKSLEYNSKETSIHGKVTVLSSVKLTPENQAFYKVHNCVQLIPIDKDCDISTKQTQNTGEDYIPKKKKIKTESLTPVIKTSNEISHVEMDKNTMEWDKVNITDFEEYDIGQTVLVRYFKKVWKYYVGVIENISLNPREYTITYYKSIGKQTDVKFVKPKRQDQDCVPECNVVKQIELFQINKCPVKYMLVNSEDGIYF